MPRTLITPQPVDAETVVERSSFVARVARVDTEEDALRTVAAVAADFPDAGHHCWGFVVGADQEHRRQRASDDGEPGGTAGVPMLGVLTGRDLVDVVAVVSRWFGGVKLGAGGLVRAYSGAVSAALDRAETGELVRRDVMDMSLSHTDAGRVEGILRQHGFTVDDTSYAADVRLRVIGDGDLLDGILASATSGSVTAERAGHRWVLED